MRVYGVVRLTKDAEVREFEKGKVIKFRVAGEEGYGDRKKVAFLDVDFFVNKDSKVAEFLKKGKEIFLEGTLKTEEWEKDGQKYSKLVVVADNVKLLGGNGKGSKPAEEPEPEPVEVVDDDFEF